MTVVRLETCVTASDGLAARAIAVDRLEVAVIAQETAALNGIAVVRAGLAEMASVTAAAGVICVERSAGPNETMHETAPWSAAAAAPVESATSNVPAPGSRRTTSKAPTDVSVRSLATVATAFTAAASEISVRKSPATVAIPLAEAAIPIAVVKSAVVVTTHVACAARLIAVEKSAVAVHAPMTDPSNEIAVVRPPRIDTVPLTARGQRDRGRQACRRRHRARRAGREGDRRRQSGARRHGQADIAVELLRDVGQRRADGHRTGRSGRKGDRRGERGCDRDRAGDRCVERRVGRRSVEQEEAAVLLKNRVGAGFEKDSSTWSAEELDHVNHSCRPSTTETVRVVRGRRTRTTTAISRGAGSSRSNSRLRGTPAKK